ncbi:MAG: hypothetical protein K0Q53_1484 [Massilibacillus sp.]|jgi:hypothetical protein|nr:hypothetical protein [Massilibacillus sp.]
MLKPKHFLFLFCLILILLSTYYLIPITPLKNRYISPPTQVDTIQKKYDYYDISDEADQKNLMRIPVVVNIGDELITEDNKLYRVTRIEENHAYAAFIRNVKLR